MEGRPWARDLKEVQHVLLVRHVLTVGHPGPPVILSPAPVHLIRLHSDGQQHAAVSYSQLLLTLVTTITCVEPHYHCAVLLGWSISGRLLAVSCEPQPVVERGGGV